MQNRGLTKRTAFSNAIRSDLYDRLKDYSEKTSIPISKLLDKAIESFLQSVEE